MRAVLLAAVVALAGAPVAAAPPAPRVAAIRWPGPEGRMLHGLMAIPARARGRQPAVLVLGDGGIAPGGAARRAAERLAAAGLLACALDGRGLAGATDDARATVAWLATNRYAAGKVAALGFGGGLAVARTLADEGRLAAVVLVGAAMPAAAATPSLAADPAILAEAPDAATGFAPVATFLKEHLK